MTIKIACIGLGWVSLHRHIPAIQRQPAFQLIGVVDRHPGKAATTAQRFKLPYSAETDDLNLIPWMDQVDAVTVSTPPFTHAALVQHALSMGKHVLSEKPFAMSVHEGEAMVKAAEDNQKTLAVVHNFQFGKAATQLMADLSQNKLGKIERISAVQLGNPRRRLPEWYEQLPLGLFYDESPHFFYLLRNLSGGTMSLQHAQAIASPQGNQTPSALSLFYRGKNHLPVTINCQFDSPLSEWHIFVSGSEGMGIIDIFRDIYLRLPNDNSHGLLDVLKTSAIGIWQHTIQHIPNGIDFLRGRLDYGNNVVFSRFANAIQTGTPPEGINNQDALAVLKLQHEATNALEKAMFR